MPPRTRQPTARLKRIRKEIRQAQEGTHRELLEMEESLKMSGKKELDEAREVYEEEINNLKESYERKLRQCEIDHVNGVRNAREELLKEIEDGERMAELEFTTAEIGRIHHVNPENGKKTLRGRGGGDLIIPPSYLNANPKPSTPSITQAAQFLLSEAEIAADLRIITKVESSSPAKVYRRDVQLTKQKLSYDTKAFKQGEEVVVENNEYGKFQARIEQINDNVVIFKASLGWDIRQIHASCADLQEGRVVIHKKRAT